MRCRNCGTEMDPEAQFCPGCGRALSTRGPAPREVPGTAPQAVYRGSPTAPWSYSNTPITGDRVATHLRPLSTLWLVYAGLRAFGGVVGLLVVTAIGHRHFGPLVWMTGAPVPYFLQSPAWLGFAVPAIIASTLLACGLALVTGIALLRHRRWGRVVAIVAAVLALLRFPLGTALGAYTLWVLAPRRAGEQYQVLAATRF